MFGRPSKQFMASPEGRSRWWDRLDVLGRAANDGRGINEFVEVPEDLPVFGEVERDGERSEATSCSSRRSCSSVEKCWRRTFSGKDKNQEASALETRPVPEESRDLAMEGPHLRKGKRFAAERGRVGV